ncbi:MAG: nitroreductase family protein [Candidatus Bathyarchaeota archaeon]|nr:nitroreductase family protein [Candidatus Bathyarchaeota archaeon]
MLGVYLGFALQNMWLVAVSHGVGAAFNGMPLLDIRKREVFYEHLGIPVSWETPGAFCFGYPQQ